MRSIQLKRITKLLKFHEIALGGRPRIDQDKLEQARILYQNSDKSAGEVCQLFGFSRRTLFTYMKGYQKSLT